MDFPLRAERLCLGYDSDPIVEDLSVAIPRGSFTAIIGANACGKSTLLKALSRLIVPRSGRVLLEGRDLAGLGAKAVARQLAVLPQAPLAPEGIKVQELVARGRFPHQSLLRQWSQEDARSVEAAMAATAMAEFADRPLSDLSGGQRQRAWIAMVLAQNTDILLLDEPTTWLDIAHQISVLQLLAQLHREGRTVVAVLHELNLAFRHADHLIALKAGRIVAEGPPAKIVTEAMIAEVFGLAALVMADPLTGAPMIVPRP